MPNRSNLKKKKEREGRRETEREGGTEGAKERRSGEEMLPCLVHSLKLQSIMAEKAWQQEHETAVMWDPQSTHLKNEQEVRPGIETSKLLSETHFLWQGSIP